MCWGGGLCITDNATTHWISSEEYNIHTPFSLWQLMTSELYRCIQLLTYGYTR